VLQSPKIQLLPFTSERRHSGGPGPDGSFPPKQPGGLLYRGNRAGIGRATGPRDPLIEPGRIKTLR
jgi:hypothetical protein